MSSVVPEGWDNFPLQDICFFQEGPGLRNWQYRDSGTKFINIRCIKDGDIDTSIAQHLSNEEVEEKYSHFLLNEGDYVLSSSGTIGRLALVKKHHLPLLLNTSVIRFRSIDETRLDSLYLRHFLLSKQFFDKITEQSQGSAQVNFGPTHLKIIDALLPPLPEQKKIASILTSVDEVIENTQKQIDKLQDLKKATMNELLTKGIGHTEFKDSELGRIPKSWVNRKFGQLCRQKSVKYDGKSELPVLSVTKYDGFVSSLDYFNKQVFSRDLSSYKVVRKGQFAYATIHLDEGSLGLLSDYDGGLISPMYTVFETTQECNSKFLFFLMKSDLYMAKYPALGQGSINRRMSISFRSLSELNIAAPPLPEQEKIASILISIDKIIEEKQHKLTQTQSLKKSLMQDLLTGKVRVTVN